MVVTRRGFLKRALAAIGALVVGRSVVEGYLKAEREWYLPPEPAAWETGYVFKGGYEQPATGSLYDEPGEYFVSDEWLNRTLVATEWELPRFSWRHGPVAQK